LIRSYASPTLFGVAMAAVVYAVSVPLLFWMLPVVAGLLFCIPIAMLSSRRFAYTGLLCTPEEVAPPDVLIRANELARGLGPFALSPLRELRENKSLLENHLINLPLEKRRNRGKVDPHLAIARAKIEDAESFEEALSYLTSQETLAVLSSPKLLRAVCALSLTRDCDAPTPGSP